MDGTAGQAGQKRGIASDSVGLSCPVTLAHVPMCYCGRKLQLTWIMVGDDWVLRYTCEAEWAFVQLEACGLEVPSYMLPKAKASKGRKVAGFF